MGGVAGQPNDKSKSQSELIAELEHLREQLAVAASRREVHDKGEAALIAARNGAVRADNAKDRFLAMLSHELRTPISPVLMLVTLRESDPSLPDSIREDFATIRRNVELQLGLIDDLFDTTAITSGKLRLRREAVSIHAVLDTVGKMFTSEVQKKRLELTWDLAAANDTVTGDVGRLSQIYWNLFRNAMKFTPEGGRISIRTANDATGGILVEISDTGIGMDIGAISHIFEAFDQGEAFVGTEFGGLGLGLAIAKAVVDLHGGTIRAESEGRGCGSRFTVTIPTTKASTVPKVTATVRGNSRRLHVLIVDDHADTAEVMLRLICLEGHSGTTAGSAADALTRADAERFDLVISDIGLPDASGLELMRQLKAQYGLPGIALSGYSRDEDASASKAAGFLRHLTKPVSLTQLHHAINSLF